ncbi:11989_t:CDS:2, partial [Gigaspora margarita]
MNNQLQTILPSIPLMEVTESNEYLTCRREKSKQLMHEKRAMESDEQRDKRNSQNALNMHRKRALETPDENLNQQQCVKLKSITTELLSASDRKLLRNFRTTMNKLSNKLCNVCNEQFPSIELVQRECRYCNREKGTPKKFSAKNNMDPDNIGHNDTKVASMFGDVDHQPELQGHPGNVLQELQNLTEVKEMLIAQVFTVVSVYNLCGGQYVYRGNVINFSQNMQKFATRLPYHPSLLDMLIVQRNSSDQSAFCDFQVRRDKLKENNVFYHNIEIADNILQSLPKNDTIIDQLSEASNNGNENKDSEDFISRTFVPVLPPGCKTEQDAAKRQRQNLINNPHIAAWFFEKRFK